MRRTVGKRAFRGKAELGQPVLGILGGPSPDRKRMRDRSMRWRSTYVTTLSAVGTSALS